MSPVLYRVLTWYEYSVCYVIIGTSILCTSLYVALDAYTRYRIVETCQPPRSVRLVLFRFASFRFVRDFIVVLHRPWLQKSDYEPEVLSTLLDPSGRASLASLGMLENMPC